MDRPSELGSSRDKPIEINEEDESSDGENSVIILDSDTEPEDRNEEENGDDEVSEEDEEESDEDVSDEEDSDSSVDSESVNSVWSDIDEATGDEITTEAAEAKIIRKFEKAMIFLADNNIEKGRSILKKLLDDPLISSFTQKDPDFESLEEPPRLAKMLQVFIASHKNLAKLCEKAQEEEILSKSSVNRLKNEEIRHLCQVLAYDPNNSEIWFDVAMKSVEFGDLNFAKYSFKRCENLKESLESHATLLFLTCDYTESLAVLKQFKDQSDILNDKMKYLKYKIRTTNQYYKIACDRIFGEDEVYAEVDFVEKRKILAFDERIQDLKKKIEGRNEEIKQSFQKEQCLFSAISINISADQDLPTVCTIFCDLFDRIHSYSHCRDQLIEIAEWESRQDYLKVVETVEEMLDVVECVEDLTRKTEDNLKRKKGRRKNRDEKKEYLANWRKRLFVEKNSEDVTETEACTTADEDDGDSQFLEDENDFKMPVNELAQNFQLIFSEVKLIKKRGGRREKTPPPTQSHEFIDCDLILELLDSKFSSGTHTVLELLEHTLLMLADHTGICRALPDAMKSVAREMYNRLTLFEDVCETKYHKLNTFMLELDSKKALQVLVLKYLSPYGNSSESQIDEEENRNYMLRFLWKYTQTGLKDEIKLEYLQALRFFMRTEESIVTSIGSFSTWDVDLSITQLEKKKRIESIKHLWKSKNYRNLVDIIQNDIDFSAISVEETMEISNYWVQSLDRLKSYSELIHLVASLMHFYLFSCETIKIKEEKPEKIERNMEFLLLKLQKFTHKEYRKSGLRINSTVGYLICMTFKKFPRFENDWKNWKTLYEIVKIQRGKAKNYIEQLDKGEDPNAMPLHELDLLVKAHEVLGESHCCAQKNYEFLLFIVDRIRDLIDDIPILEMCYLKDNGYLWSNMNEELSQVLFCLYGKYGRKRRARDDHENGGKCEATPEISRRILAVILVQPLPLYDEKEKLLHDVVELLNTKYPFLLEISEGKLQKVKKFKELLKQSSNLEEVNSSLRICRNDEDDYIQALVWYGMALAAFRQNSFEEAAKYSELYLLSEESVHDDRLRSSVWGMLAHSSVHGLFQLDLHEIYEQWVWRIMPSRMSIEAQQHEPVPHFELAAILYQLSSSLSRFFRTLPKTDPRRQNISDVAKLRAESREQFDKSLELTKLGDDGSQPEHQWLCYFFIGKLEAKNAKWDIIKVVESFYEAACGCELAGFYYPQKVQARKQTNFEPLEVHYQAFSAVYKYLISNEMPSLETLRKLHVLLKVLNDGHKVVKQSNSLFRVNVDVYSLMDTLVMETTINIQKQVEGNEMNFSKFMCDLREQLCIDLKEMCIRAFSLITDRFPHIKSYYRLAQLYLEKGEIDLAAEQIFKNAFKRKKRDDGMFDNCVEISCSDINRNGSFCYHLERCVKLGVQIAVKTMDLHNVVAMLVTMINIVVKNDEDHIEKSAWHSVVAMNLTALDNIVLSRENVSNRSTPSPAPGEPARKTKVHCVSFSTLRHELWKLWQAVNKCSKPEEEIIKLIKSRTEIVITHCFKSADELKNRMQPTQVEGTVKRKYNVMKRKTDTMDMAQPLLKNLVEQNQTVDGAKNPDALAKQIIQNSKNFPSVTNPNNSSMKVAVPFQSGAPGSSGLTKTPNAPTLSQYCPISTELQNPECRAIPQYSPISSEDEIQCIEPPAKKPAVFMSSSTAQTSSVVAKPSAMSSNQLKNSLKTSFSAQNLSTSGQKPTVGFLATKTNKSATSNFQKVAPGAPGPSKPSGSSAPTATAVQLASMFAASNHDQVSKFILANANSSDPQTKLLTYQFLMQSQTTSPKTQNNQVTANQLAMQLAQAIKMVQEKAQKDAFEAEKALREKAQKEAAQDKRIAQEKTKRETEARRIALEKAKQDAEKKAKAEKDAQIAYMLKVAQQNAQQKEADRRAKEAHTASQKQAKEQAQIMQLLNALASQGALPVPGTSNLTELGGFPHQNADSSSHSSLQQTTPSRSQQVYAPKPIKFTPSQSRNINAPSLSVPSTSSSAPKSIPSSSSSHSLSRPQPQRIQPTPPRPSISIDPTTHSSPQTVADLQQNAVTHASMLQLLNTLNNPAQITQLAKQLFKNN